MPVSSYPRVTVQGTGTPQNPQNGYGLMIVDSTTGLYKAATDATFAGGGATAANQVLTNAKLDTLINIFKGSEASLLNAGQVGPMTEAVIISTSNNPTGNIQVEGQVKLKGDTDNSLIGNTGDALNTKVIV